MGDNEITVPDDARADLCREMAEVYRFVASFCWPSNTRRQNEAVASWAATVMGLCDGVFENFPDLVDSVLERRAADFGLTPEELRATPRIRNLLEEMRSPAGQRQVEETREGLHRDLDRHVFAPAGGFLRVSAAPGLAMLAAEQRRAAQGPEAVSGTILLVLAAAERHHAQELASVSLNRVMRALEDLGGAESSGFSVRWMKEAWAKTRGAHLWAGLLAAIADVGQKVLPVADAGLLRVLAEETLVASPEGRAKVLGYASWFKEWGETFTPKGAAHPLFRRHALVPIQASPIEPPLQPLSAEMIRRMAAYRAPKDL
jgi:hypothetical protein